MAGFLYLIRGSHTPSKLTPEFIEQHGLSYAFEGRPASCGCHNLPKEFGSGEFTTLADPASLVGVTPHFDPEKQTWMKIPKLEAWLGVVNDSRVTPRDLLRKETVTGHCVELGDGNNWMIPMARKFSTDPVEAFVDTLPRTYVMNPDGEWMMAAEPKFSPIDKIARDILDGLSTCNETGSPFSGHEETVHLWAVTALSLNYRMSGFEISTLGLLSTRHLWPIFSALIDMIGFEELKKNRTATEG